MSVIHYIMAGQSTDAHRNKIQYDTEYESSPERIKYREELNRERRRRSIYGRGGPDISHTRENTLVLENPHTNRARHFKERGTLKSNHSPIDRAWSVLKHQSH